MCGKETKIAHFMKTVLIIDDEPVDRFISENIIQRSGLNLHTVSFPDAMKALNYLSFRYGHNGTLPEIILLDWNMPFMNGLQFLEEFNKSLFGKHQSVEIVVLTTSENPIDHRKALRAGAKRVFVKPLTTNQLLEL